jgi:probable rRNA maturation factor
MTEIINQQRKIKIETNTFKSFADLVLDEIANGKTIAIAFVSDKKMSELNNQFRGKNQTTDVLSFPFENDFDEDETFLGDIVISLEQAQRQATENNLTLENEIQQLILHGILHLLGYDHETDNGEMNHLELQLREKFGV